MEQGRLWGGALVPRIIEITFSGGALFAELKGRAKVQLIAKSETVFSRGGLGLEFVKDLQGVPTHLIDKQVSGDYRFLRTK